MEMNEKAEYGRERKKGERAMNPSKDLSETEKQLHGQYAIWVRISPH